MISSPTAPNPNKLMAQLRMMPDQQLIQYAQMHKNDPYIFPMAFQESNTRKQMRAAAQNPQAAQAPKVVDQNLQEMAQPMPEDQGIATLPAPNMQNMAGGGIVAFDDGGEVPGYAGGTLVDQVEAANQTSLRNTGFPLSPAQRARLEQTIKANLAQAAAGRAAGAAGRPFDPRAYTPQAAPAPADEIKYDPATATRRSMYPEQSAPPPAPSSVLPKPAAEPGLPSIVPTKFERTTLPSANVEDTLKLYDQAMPANIVDPLAKQREEANAPAIQAAGRQVSLFEQEVQSRKPAFEERLKKLDEKEGRVKSMEDRNVNMSLLEAGLAMMAGDSPHAFVNIGKGSQVGLKSYTEGLAKVEAARDKMDEARARIEEFRRNEDMMTAKERRGVLRDYDNTVSAAQKDMFNGVEKMYGIKRQDITSAIATQFAREDAKAQIESRENLGIAGLRSSENIANLNMKNQRAIAAMPTGLERILGNPELFDKYMKSQTGAANVRAESALRQEWAENPMVRQQYPKIEDYLMANGVGGQSGGGTGLKFLGSRPAQ